MNTVLLRENLERKIEWMRNVPIVFDSYRPRSRTRSWFEANITPRMLVKCRAFASVTAAVGNKITVLQGRCALLRRSSVYLFRICDSPVVCMCAAESRGKSSRDRKYDHDYSSIERYELTYFLLTLSCVTKVVT